MFVSLIFHLTTNAAIISCYCEKGWCCRLFLVICYHIFPSISYENLTTDLLVVLIVCFLSFHPFHFVFFFVQWSIILYDYWFFHPIRLELRWFLSHRNLCFFLVSTYVFLFILFYFLICYLSSFCKCGAHVVFLPFHILDLLCCFFCLFMSSFWSPSPICLWFDWLLIL
jgi:hypothetical protein